MENKFFAANTIVIVKVSDKALKHANREGYFAFSYCPTGQIILRDIHNPKDIFTIPEEDIKTLRKI